MNDVNRYKSIQEVVTGGSFNDSAKTMVEVNAYLELGWELIAVHARGWRDETTLETTVYILGHIESNAPRPQKPSSFKAF